MVWSETFDENTLHAENKKLRLELNNLKQKNESLKKTIETDRKLIQDLKNKLIKSLDL